MIDHSLTGFRIFLIAMTILAVVATLEAVKRTATPERPQPPSSACVAAQEATVADCRREYENLHYDAGAVNYLREERLIEYPLCKRIGGAAFFACNNYGKE